MVEDLSIQYNGLNAVRLGKQASHCAERSSLLLPAQEAQASKKRKKMIQGGHFLLSGEDCYE